MLKIYQWLSTALRTKCKLLLRFQEIYWFDPQAAPYNVYLLLCLCCILSCEICVSRFSTFCLKNYSCYHYNRHRKNREAASELLMRLKDNRDLQKFLQDCQEVCLPLTSPFLVSSKSQPAFGRRAPGIIKLIEVTNSYHM